MDRINEYIEAQKFLESLDWDNIPGSDEPLATICEALQEMQKYKYLEDKGLLLKIPVAPDTTVYEVVSNNDACVDCRYFTKGYCCDDYCDNKNVKKDGESYPDFPQFADVPLCEKHFWDISEYKISLDAILRNREKFGVTIFTTREEAEIKLKATNGTKNQQLIDKLAEPEIILEDKRLLQILVCNVGDTVYVVRNNEKQKCVIKSIIIENNRITYWYTQEKYVGEWKFIQDSVGKTVFLTEDGADRKLKELKGAD